MKRAFAFFITLCLALSLLPCAAFAEQDGWQQANGGWMYYQNGVPLKNAQWIEAEGGRYIFNDAGLLQTGDAEGDVLTGGNLYYINPRKDLNNPATCYAVRNYTRQRGQEIGITYYDADGITFMGWIKDASGSLRYQTRIPKENVPGASKDLYIYVWHAQPITEVRPDPDYPDDHSRDIPTGWYLFDDNGILMCSAQNCTVDGITYTTDTDGRILSPYLTLPGESEDPKRPALSDVEGLHLTNQQIAERFQPANAAANQTILDMTNQYRAEVGAAPLVLDQKMCVAATVRAIEMAQSGIFSHTRPNDTECFTIFEDCGFSTAHIYSMGENIAMNAGYSDPDIQACIGWRNSSGHYRNMIDTGYRTLGVGKCIGQGGKIYYVQLFASNTLR